jgi:hypothetical protein
MTPRLLNGGNGHVEAGCAHLQASCTGASHALLRSTQPMGRDVGLLLGHLSGRGGSAGARHD